MADFSKKSGNSKTDVEMIAVVREGRETKDGKFVYADVMVNNNAYKKADIEAGKGQSSPNLYSRPSEYTDANGEKKSSYENGIKFAKSQIETIEAAGGKNTLVKEDGTKYIPFKADIMDLRQTVKDEKGNPVKGEDGKNKTELVGYMPNTKTVKPTELGRLTQNRLDTHFEKTSAINEVQKANAEAEKVSKNAKLNAEASKATPEAEAQSTGLEK